MLNAMGALSLNQTGQTLLQSRKEIIPTIFSIFTSDLHASTLQEKSNAALLGGDVDELVRHHPWLRASIFEAITDVFNKIEAIGTNYVLKDGTQGHFNLVEADSPSTEAQPSETRGVIAMETDEIESETFANEGGTAPNISGDQEQATNGNEIVFDLHEMPVYQCLNNFSKVRDRV